MAEKYRAAEQAAEMKRRLADINREKTRVQASKVKRMANRPKPRV